MKERDRFLILLVIMAVVSLGSTMISIFVLYEAAIEEERDRLTETATSQARLIEAVARFDLKYSADYPNGSTTATLSQIRDAHENYTGFGETGEFTLARQEGDTIVFLLSHRHYDLNNPKPVSLNSPLAAPMKLALSGKSGTIIGPDYRGKRVLAAYEPVKYLDLGIVAKIDMDEIREPFIQASLISLCAIVVLILIGVTLFVKLSNPIIMRLKEQKEKLAAEVDQRKKSEQDLLQQKNLLNEILNAIPIPVFYNDENGRYLGFNEAYDEFFIESCDNLIGKTAFDVFPQKTAEVYHVMDEEVLKTGETKQYEIQVRNVQLGIRDVIFNKAAFNAGAITGLIGTITDITNEKRATNVLREREELLNEMGHLAKIGGWEHNLITGQSTWTKGIYEILDFDESDPIPGPDDHLNYYPPEDRIILDNAYRQAMKTGKQFDIEVRCNTTKGKIFWVRVLGRPEFSDGRCVKMKGVFQDITERKMLEERIHQSQKMESIGNLAGGVAHDYNNMLGVIIGNAELALEMLENGDSPNAELDEILNAAKRSTDITRQLLAFARRQNIAPKVVDLNNTVEGTLKMLQRLIGEDIDLTWKPGEKVWPVKIDSSQIDQILANLCVNARDAISNIGNVTIETNNITFDADYCADHPDFNPGDFVMLFSQ